MATSCCNFTTDKLPSSVLDPHKRVRHFTGLVMGEDEFRQDQLYFSARDELHQRSLHGYGIVSGLGVQSRINSTNGNPEIVVAAGLAVNPRGESICVTQDQCGDLNTWLENHRDDLLGSPPSVGLDSVRLYLVLCARDCYTDNVPVLGDPCRTLEDATAASRIADDFEICLRLAPPEQPEEQAVRELGEFLRAIEITDEEDNLSIEELADLVRELIPSGSPPQPGEIAANAFSPPLPLRLHPDIAEPAFREAYRVWVQEVRPSLTPETLACEVPREPDAGRCLLLACIEVPFSDSASGLEVDGVVDIDRVCAPLLLHTRLLQEMQRAQMSQLDFVDHSHSPPTSELQPEAHSDLLDLDADDHLQYLLVDPITRSLIQDLEVNGNLLVGLGEPAVPSGNEAVRWDRAVKVSDVAGGDLNGTYPNPQVAALQGNPVVPGALGPADSGRFLFWDGDAWRPSTSPVIENNLTRVLALSWRHGSRTLLEVTHDDEPVNGLVIAFGLSDGESSQVFSNTLTNNTFRVFIRTQIPDNNGIATFRLEELIPVNVIPIDIATPIAAPTDLIRETRSPADPEIADGVLFQIDPRSTENLIEVSQQLFIELAGDHVIDIENRAIDANFPRAELVSGEGPTESRFGIQGGRFESWVTARRLNIFAGNLNLNNATVDELSDLPNIGPVRARNIVEFRENRSEFEDIEDLLEVPGISRSIVDGLIRFSDN